MSTLWTRLTGVIGIDFDRYGARKSRFVSNHGVQFGKRPLRAPTILPALFGRIGLCPLPVLLALAGLGFGAIPNVCQAL
jgi:hypothetical protein